MKSVIAFMLTTLLLAPAAYAKNVTEPVFEDFSTFTSVEEGTSAAVNFCDSFIEIRQNSGRVTAEPAPDDKYGTSMKLKSIQSSSGGAAVNPKFGISGSSVYGFSVYLSGSDSTCRLAGKYKKASGTSWLGSNPIEMKQDGKIYVYGKEAGTFERNTWYDVRIAMRFDTHESDVYVNGVKLNAEPIKINADAVGMDYFNINAAQALSEYESAEYLDNMTAYGDCCGDFTVSSSIDGELSAVNPKTAELITLDFDRELLPDANISDIVSLCDSDGNPAENAEISPIMWGGYVKGAKITLNSPLSANTSYKISVDGATDLNGNSLSDEIEFTTIDDRPVLAISAASEFEALPENVKVDLSIVKKNFDGYTKINFYQNGEQVGTADPSAESFSVLLSGGKNEIYAVAEGDGDEVISNTLVIDGIAYDVTEEILSNSFDSASTFGTFSSYKAGAGELKAEITDAEHNNSLKFLGKQSKNGNTNTYVNTQVFNGKTGINMIEGEFRWDKLAPVKQAIVNFKVKTDENKEVFFAPININGSGAITLTHSNGEMTLIDSIEQGKWYKIRIYFDSVNKDITVIINDELKAYRVPMSNKNVVDIAYLHISVGGYDADYETLMYLDNLKINKVSTAFTVTSPQADSVIGYEQGTVIELNFSDKMNTERLNAENIVLKDINGTEVSYTPSCSEDGRSYTITPDYALQPDTEYTVYLNDKVRSANGGKAADAGTILFKTEKPPFGIEAYTIRQNGKTLADISQAESGKEFTLNVTLRNRNSENKSVKIAAGIYTPSNKLVGFNAVTVLSGRGQTEFPITMTAPDEKAAYTIRVFLLNDFSSLNVEDFMR